MNKRRILALSVVALAVVVAAGGLFASNMGFKLNKFLQNAVGGTSVLGDNEVGLPFNKQVGLTNASQLATDIGGLSPGPVAVIQRFNPVDNSLTGYSGGRTSNFALETTTGLRVRVNSGVNYIIVGSHDPSKTVELKGPAAGISVLGDNSYAYPYHSTSANASQLAVELGGLAPGPVSVIQRLNIVDNSLTGFSGGRTSNFGLLPGTAYRVRVTADTNFTPSHF